MLKMIYDIFEDIKTFTIIMILAFFGYTIINLTYMGEAGVTALTGNAYVLAFGQFDLIDEMGTIHYMFFIMFSFFVTLLLMNVLIAIMGDTYGRVQSNIVSADLKIVTSLILEYEEINALFRASKTLKPYEAFLFLTQGKAASESDEDWLGIQGYLKNIIVEQMDDVRGKLESQRKQVSTLRELIDTHR
jgi:hypothetical protein